MKRQVTLRVESLDGRIVPSATSGGFDFGDVGNPVWGSKPGGAGDGIQVLGGSKPGIVVGLGNTNTGIELFGGSKPSVHPGGIGLLGGSKPGTGPFGSKGAANPGENSTEGIELFGGSKPVANGGGL